MQGKESVMRITGIANPAQIAILAKLLDDYCVSNHIAFDSIERENAGRLLMALFNNGGWRTVKELKAVLAASRDGVLPGAPA